MPERDVSDKQRPTVLYRDAVDKSLAPTCGRARERADLRVLEVFEASDDRAGLDNPLPVDLFPLEDPKGVNRVRCLPLRHSFERVSLT